MAPFPIKKRKGTRGTLESHSFGEEHALCSTRRRVASEKIVGVYVKRLSADRKRSYASRERSYADRKRSYASRERSYASRKRSYASRERSYASRKRSSASGKRSSASRERSSASRKRSYADRKRSYASRERSSASRERSSASGKRSYADRKRSSAKRSRSYPKRNRPSANMNRSYAGGKRPTARRSGRSRYFSMYAVRGWTTPWRSLAAAPSGGGEAIIGCMPATAWMLAVIAILLPPSAATWSVTLVAYLRMRVARSALGEHGCAMAFRPARRRSSGASVTGEVSALGGAGGEPPFQ